MTPATRVVVKVVAGVGIAWFALWLLLAVVLLIMVGTYRGEGRIVVTACAYSLPGAVAAAIAMLLLRQDPQADDRRGFDVLPQGRAIPRPDRKK